MNAEKFIEAYSLSRNGTNQWYRHSMVPSFLYTDGVRECAVAGVYWLLDIAATEVKEALHIESDRHDGYMGSNVLEVKVEDSQATIKLFAYVAESFLDNRPTNEDGMAVIFEKHVPFTDMPEGTWNFLVAAQEECTKNNVGTCPVVMCLLSEN